MQKHRSLDKYKNRLKKNVFKFRKRYFQLKKYIPRNYHKPYYVDKNKSDKCTNQLIKEHINNFTKSLKNFNLLRTFVDKK